MQSQKNNQNTYGKKIKVKKGVGKKTPTTPFYKTFVVRVMLKSLNQSYWQWENIRIYGWISRDMNKKILQNMENDQVLFLRELETKEIFTLSKFFFNWWHQKKKKQTRLVCKSEHHISLLIQSLFRGQKISL